MSLGRLSGRIQKGDVLWVGTQINPSNSGAVVADMALISATMKNTHYAAATQFTYHNRKNSGWASVLHQEEETHRQQAAGELDGKVFLSEATPPGVPLPIKIPTPIYSEGSAKSSGESR